MAKHRVYGWKVINEGSNVAVFNNKESAETVAWVLEDTYDTGGFEIVPVYRRTRTISLGTFKQQNPDLFW